ncbi:hypothetical protein EW146_g6999 [Bondarzewia mesenterica]|uniref:Methyltransferase domain-containing protein n=1 Tax=Bondarzewia mesenterica TaxID=1095465 RepID=A0A4V3XEE4_9AGAM|nr:hypothetical protein EW146_g6999 [Bondarzewia mesenterica]
MDTSEFLRPLDCKHPGDEKSSYMFAVSEQELKRLDEQHNGITRYLEGKLSLAPLDKPRKILEMGAGTGAWAIQAALQYPDAEVLAVDMSPLPSRYFPSNVKFEQLDLLNEFPWEKESFDVIHLRLVLYHIPHPADLIRRAIPLLKPHGWLLIEDTCLMFFPHASGPAQRKRNEITSAYMESRDIDPRIGSHLEHILQSSGGFSDIFVHKVEFTLTPLPDGKSVHLLGSCTNIDRNLIDPAIRPLAETMRNSVVGATTRSLSDGLVAAGMTPELQIAWKEEMDDPRYDPTQLFFFTWSRKHASTVSTRPTSSKSGRLIELFDSGLRTESDSDGSAWSPSGTPYLYGLAISGEQGMEEDLRGFLADTEIMMGLSGHRSIEEIWGNYDEILYKLDVGQP